MVELGFSFSAWNGLEQEEHAPASLSVDCGAYSPVVGNSVVVSFDPATAPPLDRLQGMLRAAVAAFDPEDGVVVSRESSDAYSTLPILQVPAVFRYKRGAGFSAD